MTLQAFADTSQVFTKQSAQTFTTISLQYYQGFTSTLSGEASVKDSESLQGHCKSVREHAWVTQRRQCMTRGSYCR